MCYNGIFKMKKLLGNDIIKKSKIISQYDIFIYNIQKGGEVHFV